MGQSLTLVQHSLTENSQSYLRQALDLTLWKFATAYLTEVSSTVFRYSKVALHTL